MRDRKLSLYRGLQQRCRESRNEYICFAGDEDQIRDRHDEYVAHGSIDSNAHGETTMCYDHRRREHLDWASDARWNSRIRQVRKVD